MSFKHKGHAPVKEQPRVQAAAPQLTPAQLVMGRNCVQEVLRHTPKRVLRVFCSIKNDEPGGVAGAVVNLARQHKIGVEFVTQDELTSLVGSSSHQSFAAHVTSRPSIGLKEYIASKESAERALILCLDEVMDPHNLGAIFRAAECFGVDALLWSKNRGVGITPTVSKSSVGASELVPSIQVSNLADALRKIKEAGFWIVAADADPSARALNDFEFPDKVAIVLGSEGEGLSRLVKELADYPVYIPLRGKIQSLNVSQAATLFLAAAQAKSGDRQK
ncbi:MAG: 23S rRNA (guanosine(2251)-2'-O)-methyltransferase RlmB [Oligoflexia bacterium]|nr:23S rRNA (guanosine(2251)-2'-O)-methyltransferase RlmB [Oligoflexia bacterium]